MSLREEWSFARSASAHGGMPQCSVIRSHGGKETKKQRNKEQPTSGETMRGGGRGARVRITEHDTTTLATQRGVPTCIPR